MENTSILGSLAVGCLIGYNQGDITNCHVIGDITGPSYWFTDVDQVGGLVGYNSYGSITNCSSAGAITCPLTVVTILADVSGMPRHRGWISPTHVNL